MADLRPGTHALFLREEDLRQAIELMFYAYRDFTAGPDAALAELGLGRAHHRALYFIGRYPGINVSRLLAILRITKQSLARVLSELMAQGYVAQRPGRLDRRQRLLALTESGIALERRLFDVQRHFIGAAYRGAGPAAVDGYRRVLLGMLSEEDRAAVLDPGAIGLPQAS